MISQDRVGWIMDQFYKGCFLFPWEGQPGRFGLYNPNGRPVQATPIETELIDRLLAAGWIERHGQDLLVTQKGLCAMACDKPLPEITEPSESAGPELVWVNSTSCKLVQMHA